MIESRHKADADRGYELLSDRIIELVENDMILAEVKEWAAARRYILDQFGPCLTTADGEYIDVTYFEYLEEILNGHTTETAD